MVCKFIPPKDLKDELPRPHLGRWPHVHIGPSLFWKPHYNQYSTLYSSQNSIGPLN